MLAREVLQAFSLSIRDALVAHAPRLMDFAVCALPIPFIDKVAVYIAFGREFVHVERYAREIVLIMDRHEVMDSIDARSSATHKLPVLIDLRLLALPTIAHHLAHGLHITSRLMILHRPSIGPLMYDLRS